MRREYSENKLQADIVPPLVRRFLPGTRYMVYIVSQLYIVYCSWSEGRGASKRNLSRIKTSEEESKQNVGRQ